MTHPAGRQAGRPAVRIILLTQDDCHYCEHAKAVLERVGRDHPIEVTEIDLRSDDGHRIAATAGVPFAPGILLENRLFGYGRLSERRLRRALETHAAPHS